MYPVEVAQVAATLGIDARSMGELMAQIQDGFPHSVVRTLSGNAVPKRDTDARRRVGALVASPATLKRGRKGRALAVGSAPVRHPMGRTIACPRSAITAPALPRPSRKHPDRAEGPPRGPATLPPAPNHGRSSQGGTTRCVPPAASRSPPP